MISKKDIIAILEKNSTTNEYYECVSFYEFNEVAEQIIDQLEQVSKLPIHSVSRFSEDDLKTCYRIGFNHAKAVASYQGDNVVEALKKADDMDRNIKWE